VRTASTWRTIGRRPLQWGLHPCSKAGVVGPPVYRGVPDAVRRTVPRNPNKFPSRRLTRVDLASKPSTGKGLRDLNHQRHSWIYVVFHTASHQKIGRRIVQPMRFLFKHLGSASIAARSNYSETFFPNVTQLTSGLVGGAILQSLLSAERPAWRPELAG
jgi:hypothetical protein